jgi:hypothetical protein
MKYPKRYRHWRWKRSMRLLGKSIQPKVVSIPHHIQNVLILFPANSIWLEYFNNEFQYISAYPAAQYQLLAMGELPASLVVKKENLFNSPEQEWAVNYHWHSAPALIRQNQWDLQLLINPEQNPALSLLSLEVNCKGRITLYPTDFPELYSLHFIATQPTPQAIMEALSAYLQKINTHVL